MRLQALQWGLLLGAARVSRVLAAEIAIGPGEEIMEEEEEEEPVLPTVFDGKTVPVMMELTPTNFDDFINSTKHVFVKHFSPYCPHCIQFAPTWQTLYEFYYTSPEANFTTTYDFRFASMDCVAYYDMCVKHDVTSYPTMNMFRNGTRIESLKGKKELNVLSEVIEDVLEAAKPGSRPAKIILPEVGADARSATEATVASGSSVMPTSTTSSATSSTPVAKATTVDTATPVEKKPVVKPTKVPNPSGFSVDLSAEAFQNKVTMTQDPWFIKFYAPWCHHCQAMAPNWQQLAKQMEGRLNIGEVNCEAESRLCKEVRVRGYPTIVFFKGGERVEYDGLRGLGDFVVYAEKALDITAGVPDVTAETFEAMEKKEEVIFMYFYDHATTTEDHMALERLPLSLIGRAKLVKTDDPKLYDRYKITTWPRLLVSRDGRPTYYTPFTPREMRDTRQVLDWMRSVWLPMVPELTASNAREIMDNKLVVLGILNRDDEESFNSARREMKSAANEWMDKQIQLFQLERQELRDTKQLRIEEAEDRGDQRALRAAKAIRINMDRADHREVAFAWVDGVFWQRWIRTTFGIDVKEGGERVVINDENNRRYWDQTTTGNYIVPSRTSILETINKVTASPPKIKPKSTISSIEKIIFDIKVVFSDHPKLAYGSLAVVAIVIATYFRGRMRRKTGQYGGALGHFQLSEELPSIKDFKAPLLGSAAGGKTD